MNEIMKGFKYGFGACIGVVTGILVILGTTVLMGLLIRLIS